MNAILFEEKQRFNQWWLILILITPFILMLYASYMQLFFNEDLGNERMDDVAVLIFDFVYVIFLIFFFNIRLVTQIDEDGIDLSFKPFSIANYYPWASMESVSIVQYAPLKDYLGWGVRRGKDGEAFTIKGNIAIKIIFTNGTQLLIGTQCPEQIEAILKANKKTKTH